MAQLSAMVFHGLIEAKGGNMVRCLIFVCVIVLAGCGGSGDKVGALLDTYESMVQDYESLAAKEELCLSEFEELQSRLLPKMEQFGRDLEALGEEGIEPTEAHRQRESEITERFQKAMASLQERAGDFSLECEASLGGLEDSSNVSPRPQQAQMNSGELYYSNGAVEYRGGLERGKPHGKGTEFRKDGSIEYEGGWNQGKEHGTGTKYNRDGSIRYEGQWQNGRYHGYGVEYDRDGSIDHRGQFCEGREGPCAG